MRHGLMGHCYCCRACWLGAVVFDCEGSAASSIVASTSGEMPSRPETSLSMVSIRASRRSIFRLSSLLSFSHTVPETKHPLPIRIATLNDTSVSLLTVNG